MSSPWYTPTGTPATNAHGSSSDMRNEFAAIEAALDKLPALTANNIVVVNSAGSALIPLSSLTVALGGTGASTLTSGGILIGGGTGAITATAELADGEMLVGDGSGAPAIESGATLRTSLGLGTSNSPTFAGLTVPGKSITTSAISNDNTVLGIGALLNATSADYVTAVGATAAGRITVGSSNSAFGYAALGYATIAVYNTAIGTSALYYNVSGASNTAVGYRACLYATQYYNTGIGASALLDVSTGTNNTGLGYLAGSDIDDGSFNTVIGASAKVGDPNAEYRIVIGTGLSATTDNQVSIGKISNIVSCDFGTDAVWTRSSDLRRKTDVQDSSLGLAFIDQLRPVTYRWRPAEELPEEWGIDHDTDMDTETVMTGLIAQEVKSALDNLGFDMRFPGWSDSHTGQRISGEAFIYPLINAVKELSARVAALETLQA